MNSTKLTDFAEKIKNGKAPMPLLTCLHVRPKTSALTFHGKLYKKINTVSYGPFLS